MLGYMDKEKVLSELDKALEIIENLPTEDVVSREEYDRVVSENERMKEILGGHYEIKYNELRSKIDKMLKEVKTDCCVNCKYYHRMKHNFEVNKGFEESHCCDVLMKGEPGGWIQEVAPNDMCEMFTRKETEND